jgi:multidrug efflux pump subunit AcrA (membrane-fusion protein)
MPGVKADLRLREFPDRTFTATLVRTARAIDPATRTLLTEFEVPNPDGALLPGAYAEVSIKLPTPASTLLLPVNTLLFRGEGMRVAVVAAGRRIVLKPVVIGRDYGTQVEILSGLGPDDTVVINPPDSLADGQEVRTVQHTRALGGGGSR